MTILSIHHVQLAIPEGQEETARTFYVNILGLVEIPKPASLIKRGGAWFQSGEIQIHLGVDRDFHSARKAHPAFIVDDLEAILEKAQIAGFEWDLSQPELDGYKLCHVYDPFGNRIELMEKT
jgi:catechol 2,3-dioxygenase-like lactoylglutathione lyase family enzyme